MTKKGKTPWRLRRWSQNHAECGNWCKLDYAYWGFIGVLREPQHEAGSGVLTNADSNFTTLTVHLRHLSHISCVSRLHSPIIRKWVRRLCTLEMLSGTPSGIWCQTSRGTYRLWCSRNPQAALSLGRSWQSQRLEWRLRSSSHRISVGLHDSELFWWWSRYGVMTDTSKHRSQKWARPKIEGQLPHDGGSAQHSSWLKPRVS